MVDSSAMRRRRAAAKSSSMPASKQCGATSGSSHDMLYDTQSM
jgi:hypothetical protein